LIQNIDQINLNIELIQNVSSVNVGTKRPADINTDALEIELIQKESQTDVNATIEEQKSRRSKRLNTDC
jgi:hypothetical protein